MDIKQNRMSVIVALALIMAVKMKIFIALCAENDIEVERATSKIAKYNYDNNDNNNDDNRNNDDNIGMSRADS